MFGFSFGKSAAIAAGVKPTNASKAISNRMHTLSTEWPESSPQAAARQGHVHESRANGLRHHAQRDARDGRESTAGGCGWALPGVRV